MEWLQELLKGVEGITEEQSATIVSSFKTEFPKHAVPKDQYSKKVDELGDANTQLGDARKSIEALSKDGENSGELKQQIETITQSFDDYKANAEKRETNREKKLALINSLVDGGMIKSAASLYATQYDLEKVVLSADKKVVDANLIIDPIKESSKELFSTVSSDGNPPTSGETPPDTSGMSDAEYYALNKKGE